MKKSVAEQKGCPFARSEDGSANREFSEVGKYCSDCLCVTDKCMSWVEYEARYVEDVAGMEVEPSGYCALMVNGCRHP